MNASPSSAHGWEDQLPTLRDAGPAAPPEALLRRLRLAEEYLKEEYPARRGPRLLYRWKNAPRCAEIIGPEVVVGRGEGVECTLPDAALSRQHFRITARCGEFILRDLDSRNGTRVNGERISERILIPGDLIEAGGVMFIFMTGGA